MCSSAVDRLLMRPSRWQADPDTVAVDLVITGMNERDLDAVSVSIFPC
jgi:hypothetical protein